MGRVYLKSFHYDILLLNGFFFSAPRCSDAATDMLVGRNSRDNFRAGSVSILACGTDSSSIDIYFRSPFGRSTNSSETHPK